MPVASHLNDSCLFSSNNKDDLVRPFEWNVNFHPNSYLKQEVRKVSLEATDTNYSDRKLTSIINWEQSAKAYKFRFKFPRKKFREATCQIRMSLGVMDENFNKSYAKTINFKIL